MSQEAYDEQLYAEARAVVSAEQRVAIVLIQRRLAIGFNKACALVDRLERDGVVSPPDHIGRREVLAAPVTRTAERSEQQEQ